MNMHEWPLTLFTVLSQMAVGAFWMLGFIQLFGTKLYGAKAVKVMTPPALYAIGPAMVLGLAGSTLHLGTMSHAPNAIRHIATSWLTREIVFGAGFAVLGFLFALAVWMNWFSEATRKVLAAIIAVWGVVFVWVMASVYMVPTIPAWNSWATPAQFYLTSLILGALGMGVAYTTYPFLSQVPFIHTLVVGRNAHAETTMTKEDNMQVRLLVASTIRWAGFAAMFLLILELIVMVYTAARPEVSNNPPLYPFPMAWFVIRLVLVVIGAGGLGYYLTLQARPPVSELSVKDAAEEEPFRATADKRLMTLVTVAFILVLISEFIGRFMFYGSMDRIGI